MKNVFPRAYLALAGFALLAFGFWFIIDPIGGTTRLGLTVTGANASFEMRGIYGGVHIGLGLLALAGAIRNALQAPANWALLAYFGGYTLARATSLAIGEYPTGAFVYYAIFEAVMFVLALLSLRTSRRT